MNNQKVALVAWELGAGRGHLEHLKPIVTGLLTTGWTVVAAVRDLKRGHTVLGGIDRELRHKRFAIGQAPIFVHRASPPPVRPSSLAEIIAHMGFADAARLRPVVETWEQLLEAFRPKVLVADFAPSAVIAARGRVPTVVIGNGWTIPPDGSPIPRLPIEPYDAVAAAAAENQICATVADVTSARWSPDRFVQLLRGDRCFVFTSRLLDPYRAFRRDRMSWPPNLIIPTRGKASGRPIAVIYLPRNHPKITSVLQACTSIDSRAVAYFAGADIEAPPNVKALTMPIDLASALPHAPFAIHHGGLGITNWCLAYQVPQIIIPPDLEKGLIGHAMASNGSGIVVPLNASSEAIVAAIRSATALRVPRPSLDGFSHSDAAQTVHAIVQACESIGA